MFHEVYVMNELLLFKSLVKNMFLNEITTFPKLTSWSHLYYSEKINHFQPCSCPSLCEEKSRTLIFYKGSP